MTIETPSETAELHSRMAALRRSNEALTNARRRDQEMIVELRAELAKLEEKFERSQLAYECCFSALKTC